MRGPTPYHPDSSSKWRTACRRCIVPTERIDAEWTRLADQLAELDAAERVLSHLSPGKRKAPRRRRVRTENANGSVAAQPSRRRRVARGRKVTAKAAPSLGEAILRAVGVLGDPVSAEQIRANASPAASPRSGIAAPPRERPAQ